ncbi:MAG: alpha/beta hydrolase [Promethearchaeota archaeon]|nr:MAG: alpha/beta hydrolase [Candidatus Lokiarchaeota archaeon]
MTDQFAIVNGIRICYDIQGEGNPVILIHGFSDRKEHWRAQVGTLSQHFKVIRMDNRGAGKSERPEGEYTMEIYASDVAGLMDYLGINRSHIIGHSLGGMIAQNFAILYPERVEKLILINTIPGLKPPGENIDEAIKMYRENAINGHKAIMKDPLNEFLKGAKASYSRNFWKSMKENPKKKFHDIWSVEDLINEKIENGPTIKDLSNQAHALSTHNTYNRLNEIKSEVLILSAEKDKSCPKSMGEKMHELIPNSNFIVIKGAAHQSILEKAPKVNQLIIDFLKS